MNNTTSTINFYSLPNDNAGNPRYVCEHSVFLTESEQTNLGYKERYNLAAKRANTIGGKKFNTKTFAYGIIFSTYNTKLTETAIRELMSKY